MNPGLYVDSDHPDIKAFAEEYRGDDPDTLAVAKSLYTAARDQVYYDPYCIRPDPSSFRASAILHAGKGHCVGKAVFYAAVLRAAGIPARLGFADVRNHLATPRLRELMGTDMFYHHGYTQVWLGERWLKATPAFNKTLCEKFGIRPLEFDGTEDSIFHPFDSSGRQHMEYVTDHGIHLDLPYDEMISVYQQHYPAMFVNETEAVSGDFEAEALATNT